MKHASESTVPDPQPAVDALIPAGSRNEAMDVLRGFAVLGILFMNLIGYGLIGSDYVNPLARGSISMPDWWAWAFTHIFTEQKFMTLFCLLAGAGTYIAAERLSNTGARVWPAFLRRSAVLLVFGLLHAYLIWYGDVLMTYAVAGFIPFMLRRCRPRTLHIVGGVLLTLPILLTLLIGFAYEQLPPIAHQGLNAAWTPEPALIAAEEAAYRGSWLAQMPRRMADAVLVQTSFLLALFLWRAAGLMLIGMALYKSGFLTGKASIATYRRTALIGIGVGLPIVIGGVVFNEMHGWNIRYSMHFGSLFNYCGSVLVALGYAALVIWAVQARRFAGLRDKLQQMGRATLTLYILHSVIGTLIFYGHGLGLYASIPRWGLLAMVVPIWLLEYVLVRYTFIGKGPLDYVMRRVTTLRPRSTAPDAALAPRSA